MRIFAILVTYKFDLDRLFMVTNTLANQVEKLIIVNNNDGELNSNEIEKISNVHIINNYKNLGIAAAQNIGIKYCQKNGATHILFSDQDTIFDSNFIEKMKIELEKIDDEKLSCLSPALFNTVLKIKEISILDDELKFTISSGQIIPVKIFDLVGLYDEQLFIDWVDIEWCYRANNLNFKIYQTENVMINNSVGDCKIKIFGKNFNAHSDIRHFYMIRNGFYLLLYKNFTYGQKRNILHRLIKIYMYMIIGYYLKKREIMKLYTVVFKGAIFGIINKMGRYDGKF